MRPEPWIASRCVVETGIYCDGISVNIAAEIVIPIDCGPAPWQSEPEIERLWLTDDDDNPVIVTEDQEAACEEAVYRALRHPDWSLL